MKFLQQTQTICSQYVPGHRALPMAVPRAWTPHSSSESLTAQHMPRVESSNCNLEDAWKSPEEGRFRHYRRRILKATSGRTGSCLWRRRCLIADPVTSRASQGRALVPIQQACSADVQGSALYPLILKLVYKGKTLLFWVFGTASHLLKSWEEQIWWGSQQFCLGYKNGLSGISAFSRQWSCTCFTLRCPARKHLSACPWKYNLKDTESLSSAIW